MSPFSASSKWVAKEIAHAERRGKPIVPLLLAGDVFFRLGDLHFIDVTKGRMPGARFIADLIRLRQSAVDL